MNYQQALDYIDSFTNYEKTPRPHIAPYYDLRRMDELLVRLGNPHLKAKSVHITGTKGKGSTSAMIASILTASGYTTGLYTSPHLLTLRERIQVNSELITENELVALVQKLQPEVEAVNQKATYGKLTTFELLTALGFAHFSSKQADFQVLEVGIGGRLDATNVIPSPEVGIITSISFDHMDVLGNTIVAIATEKAGIIKSGTTVVLSPQPYNETDRVISDVCLSRGVRLVKVGSDVTWQSLGFNLERQLLRVEGKLGSYELSIPLLGQYQLENTATAVAAAEVLTEKGFNISKESIITGLARVSWPGRFQIFSRHPLLIIDGAHNAYSAGRLKQSLEQYFSPDRAILVIGASSDKDITGITSELAPFFDEVIVTCAHNPRSMEPARIVAEFAEHRVKTQVAEEVPAALSLALSLAKDKDLICVTGSLFVVSEAIEEINRLHLTA